jgi:hypothetical protein
MLFSRAKKNAKPDFNPKPELIYAWRGKPQSDCPAVYVAIQRVDGVGIDRAIRCRDRTRGVVRENLLCENPSPKFVSYWDEVAAIWDEILPMGDGDSGLPTHFLEVGLEQSPNIRSPILTTAIQLNRRSQKRGDNDGNYCSIEIGGFIADQIMEHWRKTDFEGALIKTKPKGTGADVQILRYIFAKWKSLRVR